MKSVGAFAIALFGATVRPDGYFAVGLPYFGAWLGICPRGIHRFFTMERMFKINGNNTSNKPFNCA
jgi:hypothetical protein